MTQSPPYPDPASEPSSRERIDALLDEALAESFPASDSSAIGSGVAAIKQKHREPRSGGQSHDQASTCVCAAQADVEQLAALIASGVKATQLPPSRFSLNIKVNHGEI